MNGKSLKLEYRIVGKLDCEIFECISDEIVTDEVVITNERIEHIKERHYGDYEKYHSYLQEIIERPDYIVAAKRPHTVVLLKEIEQNGEKFKLILRLKVESEPAEFKNSILSFWKIGETTWKKTIKNKQILYKRLESVYNKGKLDEEKL